MISCFYWLNWFLPSKQSQESITTPTHAQFASQACSALSTNSLPKLIKCLLQPFRALSMWREKRGELFGKNLSSAGAFLAEETTHIKDEMNWMPTRRKVMQCPTVMALDVRGDCSTLRTTRCWGRDTSRERDLIGNVNLLNEYFRKVKKGGRGCQMGESPLLRENLCIYYTTSWISRVA